MYYESLDKNGYANPLYLIQNLVMRYSMDLNDLIEGATV